jgi:hypothetical protein
VQDLYRVLPRWKRGEVPEDFCESSSADWLWGTYGTAEHNGPDNTRWCLRASGQHRWVSEAALRGRLDRRLVAGPAWRPEQASLTMRARSGLRLRRIPRSQSLQDFVVFQDDGSSALGI